MDCAVVPALHSSSKLARGLEQNGCADEKKCSVISWDYLSAEAAGTVFVCSVFLLELPLAGYRGEGILVPGRLGDR